MSINKESLQRRKNELQGDDNMNFSILEESNEQTNSNIETTLMETYEDGVKKATETHIKEFLNNSKSVLAKNRSRSYIESLGVLSMVNAKTGKRIVMSKESYQQLGQPEKVQFALTDKELLIGKTLDNASDKFNVKNYKSKGIIYSAALVKEITEAFGLDYSDRTSITFAEARVIKDEDDNQIMIIDMK